MLANVICGDDGSEDADVLGGRTEEETADPEVTIATTGAMTGR